MGDRGNSGGGCDQLQVRPAQIAVDTIQPRAAKHFLPAVVYRVPGMKVLGVLKHVKVGSKGQPFGNKIPRRGVVPGEIMLNSVTAILYEVPIAAEKAIRNWVTLNDPLDLERLN